MEPYMMNRTLAAALAVLVGTASAAYAQSSSNSLLDRTSGAQHVDQNSPLKPFSDTEMEKIRATLSAKGFTAPTVFQRDGDGYRAVAWKNTDAHDVWVDPQSGVILSRPAAR
jgi:hypothetical protein